MMTRPLYFLTASKERSGINRLWRLDPGAGEIVPVTRAEMAVSSAATFAWGICLAWFVLDALFAQG